MRFFPSCLKREVILSRVSTQSFCFVKVGRTVHNSQLLCVQSPVPISSLYTPHLISVLLQESRTTEVEESQNSGKNSVKMRKFPERLTGQVANVMSSRSSLGHSCSGSEPFALPVRHIAEVPLYRSPTFLCRSLLIMVSCSA